MVQNKEEKIIVSTPELKPYESFCKAIEKIVPELQRGIKEKNTILMTTKDLAEKIGMPGKSDTSIYWRAKYCLFNKGMIVTSTKKDHDRALLLRSRTPDDKLPPSLKKYFEE